MKERKAVIEKNEENESFVDHMHVINKKGVKTFPCVTTFLDNVE